MWLHKTSAFRGGVELIVVRVAVFDADERPIAGLTKDDFVVLENGASQPVLHFLSSDAPIDVALLLDAQLQREADGRTRREDVRVR